MVKSGKIIIIASFAIVLAALILVPLASADERNVTPVTTPFITVNPVGNHTVDEVFYITGTTNLPASGSPLQLQIYSAWFNPGGSGCDYQSSVTIEPGENGINTWSCNATPGLWQTHGIGPSFTVTPGAVPGDYVVTVASLDPRISAKDTRIISVLSPEDTDTSTVITPNLTPYHTNQYTHAQRGYWISVDHLPLGTHHIGETFGVSGETNLPVGQEIDYGAFSANYAPGSPNLLPPRFSGSTIVYRGTGEINTWSFVVNTTRFEKSFENGTVVRMAAVPGSYELSIGPFNQEVYPFTLADTVPDSPALQQNTSQGTIAATANPPPVMPTTHPASLPLAISVAATGLGAYAVLGRTKTGGSA
ncbi:hypothetical protein [Methanoregula sp. UBA64]|jgi:hypothetical protein|uniref:hypothetical protein n=1 Tax=Methanoregula sp. UBA64 TaxID=1915554 RepID=UPI0025E33D2C|nr:hypothetical protein [Methanoregula sp. UBA64]